MFEPYWRVQSYRVLGLKADPVALEPGEVAELSVLDYRPAEAEVTYRWSWCPVEPSAQESFECPFRRIGSRLPDAGRRTGDAATGGDAGREAPISLDPSLFELGGGPTAELAYPGTREQVRRFCLRLQEVLAGAGEQSGLGGRLPTSDCSRSIEVAVRLEAVTDGGEREVAKKDVQLQIGGDELNENPEHGGIAIRVAKPSDVEKAREVLDWVPPADRERSEQWFEMPEGEALPVVAGMPWELRAEVGSESIQTYRPPPPAGSDRERGEPTRERLTFRWFVSGGTLSEAQRIHIPGRNDLEELRRTVFDIPTPPASECDAEGSTGGSEERTARSPCDMLVASVVRDGRDGLNWSRRRVRVVGSGADE